MRNSRLLNPLLIAAILLAMLLLLVGCGGLKSQLVGRWQGSSDSIEFFRDGTVTTGDSLLPLTGTYSVVDGNRVRLDFGGLGALTGPLVVTVTINGDTLSMTGPDGRTERYTRVR